MPYIDVRSLEKNIDNLIKAISAYNADTNLVYEAYKHAENAHKNQKRLSGEPYIIHPLEVAFILASFRMDTTSIIAALLHDVVEDTATSLEFISKKFGDDVAQLVDGVTKISSLKKQTKAAEQAHSLRKMLLATIQDVRVIIIKLADKLHNMRTIIYQPEAKQYQISNEVLDIYAPLAGRLGMSKIQSELEDLAFYVLYPDKYYEISSMIVQRKQDIEKYIDTIKQSLNESLTKLKIKAEITGRAKHYYSVFKKMEYSHKTFDEIFDIRAIRIITDEVKDCYGILGVVHTLWSPIASRFKDYIAVPKSNMYQSLHTTVIGPDGHRLEVQIRTREMHITSEIGVASHYLYKEKTPTEKDQKKISILKNLERRELDLEDPMEFIKELKMDLYEDEIFVFTPKGKIVKLAKDSTPLDFAYAIHTQVGHTCVGAKINNSMSTLKTQLKSGDIVEILTSKKGHPSEAWLKIVKSSNARYKIRNWLKANDQKMQAAEDERKKHITAQVSVPDNELPKIKNISKNKPQTLSIDGTNNIQMKLSQCCQPIPGDEVIGFITRGRGLTVHKKDCSSLKHLNAENERYVNIVWSGTQNTYPVKIAIEALDRQNLLKDIADAISNSKTNILKMEASVKENEKVSFKFTLEVNSINHLNDIIAKIKAVKNITNVTKLKERALAK